MRNVAKIATGLLLMALLTATAGCIEALAAGAGGFGAGYLAGINAPIENICYKNGQAVDCSEIPAGLIPS